MPFSDPIKKLEMGRVYTRAWKLRNPDKVKSGHVKYCNIPENKKRIFNNKRAAHYKRAYGLTLDQLESMALDQDYKCKLCGEGKPLVVDHCHDTNKIRGLLCHFCNRRLGMWQKWTKEGKFADYVGC